MSDVILFSCRKRFADLDGFVKGFDVARNEQVIIIGDGVATALHKLVGGMSRNYLQEQGLSGDEAAGLIRLYNVLF